MKARYANRTDENQTGIVRALRKAGCRVLSLTPIGDGCADLLVYRPALDKLFLLEIKRGDLPPSKGRNRLSRHQRQFHQDWPVQVVCTVDEALAAVGIADAAISAARLQSL